jgi:predicted enzyme related to lactoylglutathione lyase
VNTWDGPRADEFFAQVFGYHQEQIGDGTSVDYTTWSRGRRTMLGRLQMNADWADPGTGAHWMLYFAVDPQTGTDAAVARVLELGGRVDFDPYDSELGRIARVADPSGAAFALIDPTQRLEPTPITIYLSDESVHEQVEAAVEGVLAAAGGHIEHRDDPVFGSWLRRMRARTGQAVLSPLARESAVVAAHGAESRLVHAQDATNTATMLQNLGPVLVALQSTKEAVIRAGALLIVKMDSTLVVHQLTSAQQLQLDHQPQLAQSPHDILSALELRAGSSTQSADGVGGTCGLTTAPRSLNGNPAPLRITSNNSEGSTPLNAADHQAFPETGAGA